MAGLQAFVQKMYTIKVQSVEVFHSFFARYGIGIFVFASVLLSMALMLLSFSLAEMSIFNAYGFVVMIVGLSCSVVCGGLAQKYFDRMVTALSSKARMASYSSHTPSILHNDPEHVFKPLFQAINELLYKLTQAKQERETIIHQATAQIEEHKNRLAAILHDLHEGVMVCNLKHQILLYNQNALGQLGCSGQLGLGRNILKILLPEPILHTLERLRLHHQKSPHGEQHVENFVCGTQDSRILIHGLMSLTLHVEGEVVQENGYVLTFRDATQELQVLAQRDRLLYDATQGMRSPIANLYAMLQTLIDSPELTPQQRQTFEQTLMDECESLSQHLQKIDQQYNETILSSWPMNDILSTDLISLIILRNTKHQKLHITMTSLPQCLHGDSYSLVLLFEHLLLRLLEYTGIYQYDLSTTYSKQWIFFDISWSGGPILPSDVVHSWMQDSLPDRLKGLTVQDVLQRHRSDMWSERVRSNYVRLRIPLPLPLQQPLPTKLSSSSQAFECDFTLFKQPLATENFGLSAAESLTYVAFDTETTGLYPSQGDALVSLAGIRIVNRRILTGETFNALINPGFPIPKESTKIHGITDSMVQKRPSAAVVIPQFHQFCTDAVLIGHNVAFDLKFLKLNEQSSGVCFTNPVLDTMVLSMMIQGPQGNHTLDGLAQQFGIHIFERHTALGDSLATAAIFLYLLDMLLEQGITTLQEIRTRSNMALEIYQRQQAF